MTILAEIRSYHDLAGALATQRKRAGMSQTRFEQHVGWDFQYLWKLETGRKYPAGKLSDWLAGVGVKLVLVPADFDISMLASKSSDLPSAPDNYHDLRKAIAAKGGRFRSYKLSKRRRTQIAREAGRASQAKRRRQRLKQSPPGAGSTKTPPVSPTG